MNTLKDFILNRDLRDIVWLAGENKVDLSDIVPANEWESIYEFATGDQSGDQYGLLI